MSASIFLFTLKRYLTEIQKRHLVRYFFSRTKYKNNKQFTGPRLGHKSTRFAREARKLTSNLNFTHPDSATNLFSPPLEKFAAHSSWFCLLAKHHCGFLACRKPSSWLSVPAQNTKSHISRCGFLYSVLGPRLELGTLCSSGKCSTN